MTAETMPSTSESRRSASFLPSPKELAEYEQLVPGAGEKILQLLQDQQNHRREVEASAMRSARREANFGLLFAATLSLLCLAGGFYFALTGVQTTGTILIAGSLALCTLTFRAGNARKFN